MNIIVLMKQVPDTPDVKLDPQTGLLQRDRVGRMANPEDKHALELALTLKDAHAGSKVVVLSMGPEPAREMLVKDALAVGADEAYLLSDPALGGSDCYVTAKVLARAIEKMGAFDLVLAGHRSFDGATAAVGPMVAEFLGLPQLSNVRALTGTDGRLTGEQAWEDEVEIVEGPLPALATVGRKGKKPRIPNLMGLTKAKSKPLMVWSLSDLGLEASQVGLAGSFTRVTRVFRPEKKGKTVVFEGASGAKELTQRLAARALV